MKSTNNTLSWGLTGNIIAALLTATLAMSANAFSATKTVDCDSNKTIADALEKASEGDTLLISGVCTENLNLTKSVTLDGQDAASIVPADNTLPTIRVVARGVTIKGLRLDSPSQNAQILITDQSLVTIESNQIGNGAKGVYAAGNSMVSIVGNHIYGNATQGVLGVEDTLLRVGLKSTPGGLVFNGNLIEGNGSAVLLINGNASVIGNQLLNNRNVGVYAASGAYARVAGDQIAGNDVGVYVLTNGHVELTTHNGADGTDGANYGVNNTLQVYCISGYLGESAAGFEPAFATESCENAMTP